MLETYRLAIDPKTTLPVVNKAIADLRATNPTRSELKGLARQMGINRPLVSRDSLIAAIHNKILSIKGTWDRKDL